jgi:O-antigen/teichoic acid export membrane protein
VSVFNYKKISQLFSTDNLTKRASLNSLAAALDYGARLLVGFIINPLLVSGLGDAAYGVWQVLGRLIGYISPASGRPTQTLKWVIAKEQASENFEEKRAYVGSTIAVSLLFAPILAVLGGVVAWFSPDWLDVSTDLSSMVRLAAGVLVANLIIISLVDIPRSILEGENLGFKRMGLSAGLVLTGGVLTAVALYLETGLVGIALATFSTTILTGVFFYKVVRTYVHWFGIAKPSMAKMRTFFTLSGWFLIWHLIMRLMSGSDVVILGIFDSVNLVTSYTLNKYIADVIVNFVSLVVIGITPGLGGIIGSGNHNKAALLRSEIMIFSWLLVTVIGSTILMWNKAFLQLWVGAGYYAGPLPNLLIVIVVMQFILIRNDANIIDLTLNLRQKVLLGLLSVILCILIAYVFVVFFKLGIIGICIGFIIGRSILSFSYPKLIGKFLHISFRDQFKHVLRPAFITLILFSLSTIMVDLLPTFSWFSLPFLILITIIIMAVIAFYTGISHDQKQQIIKRVVILKHSYFNK